MFISILDIFKIGIGPSSSHTMGPMVAAGDFRARVAQYLSRCETPSRFRVRCILKGSLSYTGKGHATDRAVMLGLNGYTFDGLTGLDVNGLETRLREEKSVSLKKDESFCFSPGDDILFDQGEPFPEHPNGMRFELVDGGGAILLAETYFSIGGGFINTLSEISALKAPLKLTPVVTCPYAFDSAESMLRMADAGGLSIAGMKRLNELERRSERALEEGIDDVWRAMRLSIENGLATRGTLPGGLNLPRRAKSLFDQLNDSPRTATVNEWLCAYAMAVSEENAAGHMVVTAPTNGAAGVIPAVLYYMVKHEGCRIDQVRDFLLTAAAIGGLIKHRSSISGAEVGCQGEVGSAAAMAAAGLCAVRGGTPRQVENAAEIALEHHLGMTCDPVRGLVQVPCIERNGFGAIKAFTAACLAIRGSGQHFMPLDGCIAAMKQTGLEMSEKFKETSLGGLAVSVTEC